MTAGAMLRIRSTTSNATANSHNSSACVAESLTSCGTEAILVQPLRRQQQHTDTAPFTIITTKKKKKKKKNITNKSQRYQHLTYKLLGRTSSASSSQFRTASPTPTQTKDEDGTFPTTVFPSPTSVTNFVTAPPHIEDHHSHSNAPAGSYYENYYYENDDAFETATWTMLPRMCADDGRESSTTTRAATAPIDVETSSCNSGSVFSGLGVTGNTANNKAKNPPAIGCNSGSALGCNSGGVFGGLGVAATNKTKHEATNPRAVVVNKTKHKVENPPALGCNSGRALGCNSGGVFGGLGVAANKTKHKVTNPPAIAVNKAKHKATNPPAIGCNSGSVLSGSGVAVNKAKKKSTNPPTIGCNSGSALSGSGVAVHKAKKKVKNHPWDQALTITKEDTNDAIDNTNEDDNTYRYYSSSSSSSSTSVSSRSSISSSSTAVTESTSGGSEVTPVSFYISTIGPSSSKTNYHTKTKTGNTPPITTRMLLLPVPSSSLTTATTTTTTTPTCVWESVLDSMTSTLFGHHTNCTSTDEGSIPQSTIASETDTQYGKELLRTIVSSSSSKNEEFLFDASVILRRCRVSTVQKLSEALRHTTSLKKVTFRGTWSSVVAGASNHLTNDDATNNRTTIEAKIVSSSEQQLRDGTVLQLLLDGVQRNTSITTIIIENNTHIDRTVGCNFGTVLKNKKKKGGVQRLEILNCHFYRSGLQMLMSGVQHCTSLQQLSIQQCPNLSRTEIETIGITISNSTQLQSLQLRNLFVHPLTPTNLVTSSSSFTALMDDEEEGDEDSLNLDVFAFLFWNIQQSRTLLELDLSYNPLLGRTPELITFLSQCLAGTAIGMRRNDLNYADTRTNHHHYSYHHIQQLKLIDCEITRSSDVKQITKALSLKNNNTINNSIEHTQNRQQKQQQVIRDIDLSGNTFGYAGAKHCHKLLLNNTNILSFEMVGCCCNTTTNNDTYDDSNKKSFESKSKKSKRILQSITDQLRHNNSFLQKAGCFCIPSDISLAILDSFSAMEHMLFNTGSTTGTTTRADDRNIGSTQ